VVHPSSEPLAAVSATLPADVALHARPAGLLVKEVTRLGCAVEVVANGKRADAKSILQVLALGASGGTELVIEVSGDGAAEAAEHLAAFVGGLA
jgi:phosphotransferase system HPr (HPr) family protein